MTSLIVYLEGKYSIFSFFILMPQCMHRSKDQQNMSEKVVQLATPSTINPIVEKKKKKSKTKIVRIQNIK